MRDIEGKYDHDDFEAKLAVFYRLSSLLPVEEGQQDLMMDGDWLTLPSVKTSGFERSQQDLSRDEDWLLLPSARATFRSIPDPGRGKLVLCDQIRLKSAMASSHPAVCHDNLTR